MRPRSCARTPRCSTRLPSARPSVAPVRRWATPSPRPRRLSWAVPFRRGRPSTTQWRRSRSSRSTTGSSSCRMSTAQVSPARTGDCRSSSTISSPRRTSARTSRTPRTSAHWPGWRRSVDTPGGCCTWHSPSSTTTCPRARRICRGCGSTAGTTAPAGRDAGPRRDRHAGRGVPEPAGLRTRGAGSVRLRQGSPRQTLHPCQRSRLVSCLVVMHLVVAYVVFAYPTGAQERVAAKAAAVSITAMTTAIAE